MSADDAGFSDMNYPQGARMSPYVDRQSASINQTYVESSKLVHAALVVAFIGLTLAGIGFGLSIGARDTAQRAERESRLQRLEVDEMRAALSRAGISTHDDTDKP
jgi:hypothetical protein